MTHLLRSSTLLTGSGPSFRAAFPANEAVWTHWEADHGVYADRDAKACRQKWSKSIIKARGLAKGMTAKDSLSKKKREKKFDKGDISVDDKWDKWSIELCRINMEVI
jgi:hypothetical protein